MIEIREFSCASGAVEFCVFDGYKGDDVLGQRPLGIFFVRADAELFARAKRAQAIINGERERMKEYAPKKLLPQEVRERREKAEQEIQAFGAYFVEKMLRGHIEPMGSLGTPPEPDELPQAAEKAAARIYHAEPCRTLALDDPSKHIADFPEHDEAEQKYGDGKMYFSKVSDPFDFSFAPQPDVVRTPIERVESLGVETTNPVYSDDLCPHCGGAVQPRKTRALNTRCMVCFEEIFGDPQPDVVKQPVFSITLAKICSVDDTQPDVVKPTVVSLNDVLRDERYDETAKEKFATGILPDPDVVIEGGK